MSCVIGSWTGARSFLTWLGLEGYSDSVLRTPYPYSIGNASHLGEKSVQRFQGYHGKARIIWDIIPRPTSTSKVGTVYLLFDYRGNCCEWPQYGFFPGSVLFLFFHFPLPSPVFILHFLQRCRPPDGCLSREPHVLVFLRARYASQILISVR